MPDCSARRVEFYSAELALVVRVLGQLCTAELVPCGTLFLPEPYPENRLEVFHVEHRSAVTDLPEVKRARPSSFDFATAESVLADPSEPFLAPRLQFQPAKIQSGLPCARQASPACGPLGESVRNVRPP